MDVNGSYFAIPKNTVSVLAFLYGLYGNLDGLRIHFGKPTFMHTLAEGLHKMPTTSAPLSRFTGAPTSGQ